jgi:hypothetical protein
LQSYATVCFAKDGHAGVDTTDCYNLLRNDADRIESSIIESINANNTTYSVTELNTSGRYSFIAQKEGEKYRVLAGKALEKKLQTK